MTVTKEEDEFRWRRFAQLEAGMPPTLTGWTGVDVAARRSEERPGCRGQGGSASAGSSGRHIGRPAAAWPDAVKARTPGPRSRLRTCYECLASSVSLSETGR